MAELMERKRLTEYLPRFMQNFSELKEFLRVTNNETDRIRTQIGRIHDEAFIMDCTEYGLRKYENLLHIIPADNESLETRKMRVLMRWYNYAPYAFRVLVNKLNMICGVNNYELQADLENYYFKLLTELGTYGSTDELAYIFESILPQNIYYESVNVLNIESECSLNYGGGTCFSGMFILTEDWKGKQTVKADLLVGGAAVSSDVQTLAEDYTMEKIIEGNAFVTGTAVFTSTELATNDFKEYAGIIGEANIAAGTVQAEFFEIKT